MVEEQSVYQSSGVSISAGVACWFLSTGERNQQFPGLLCQRRCSALRRRWTSQQDLTVFIRRRDVVLPSRYQQWGGLKLLLRISKNMIEYVNMLEYQNTSRNKVHRDRMHTSLRNRTFQIGQTSGASHLVVVFFLTSSKILVE